MRRRYMALAAIGGALAALFLANASMLAHPKGAVTILAHRGVHQLFPSEGLKNDDCTANRIYPPAHGYLENTLPSMRAAFENGADIVEIDIHPTTDGEFVVFHDWGVDCRTEGKGVTRELSLAQIKKLDVGYGYTADGGKTFPFRGKGIGMAPSLGEVLQAFPGKRFWINGKSNDPTEADRLDAYLLARPYADPSRLIFQMGERPTARIRALRPEAKVMTQRTVLACLRDYMLVGGVGITPKTCVNTVVGVPLNIGPLLWGWPDRFLERMQAVNTEVVIFAPLASGKRPGGTFDDAKAINSLPKNWRGGVSTNAVEVTGPLLKRLPLPHAAQHVP